MKYPESVTRHSLHRFTVAAGLLAAVLAGLPVGAAQAPPAPTRERINRIGADLFSATPHPTEAIAELKNIPTRMVRTVPINGIKTNPASNYPAIATRVFTE